MIIPAFKKTYNGKLVLSVSETEIKDGCITAICGYNGSGKTTLAKILAGIVKDDQGEYFSGHGETGYMSQFSLPFRMSVRNNLLLNSDKNRSKEENRKRAEDLLSAVGLSDVSSKNASRLSGGQIQRMALARVLMKDYHLLILDEPTASMDQSAIPAAEKAILDYKERSGCTIILITHSAEQAERLADSVLRIEDGRFV